MMQLSIKSMDIVINLNTITSVVGGTNSGKTYMLKKLINEVSNSDVYIDDVNINEYDITFLKNNIMVVLDDNLFNTLFVREELSYYLNRLGYNLNDIVKRIDDMVEYFNLGSIINDRIDELTFENKILIKILSFLIVKPKIFGIDNLLTYLPKKVKKQILEFIMDNEMTLINVTTDREEVLLSEYIIVLSGMKALMCTDPYNVLNGNSILPYLGMKLPFSIELSNNLIMYEILTKQESDLRKLVDKIWK